MNIFKNRVFTSKSKNKLDAPELSFPSYDIAKNVTLDEEKHIIIRRLQHTLRELGFDQIAYHDVQGDLRIMFQRGGSIMMFIGLPNHYPMLVSVAIKSDFDEQVQLQIKYMIRTTGNWLLPHEIDYLQREMNSILEYLQSAQIDLQAIQTMRNKVARKSLTFGCFVPFVLLFGLPAILAFLSPLIPILSNDIFLTPIFAFVMFGVPVLIYVYIFVIGLPYNKVTLFPKFQQQVPIGQNMFDNMKNRLNLLLTPRPFQYFYRVKSTQDVALKWLQQGAVTGSVVIADEQVKGRGRSKHAWATPPNTAIALSVILHPEVDALHQITMLGALAIYDILKSYGADNVGIKWPNDVLLNGKKVCGILPESEWAGEELKGVVLGMGINVRVDFAHSELEDIAISIEPIIGKKVDRAQMIRQLLDRIDYWYDRLGTDELFEAWRSRLVTLGHEVVINSHGEAVSGKAESVDSQGAILVRTAYGELKRVVAGDIAMR